MAKTAHSPLCTGIFSRDDRSERGSERPWECIYCGRFVTWLFLAGCCAVDDNSETDPLFLGVIDPSLSPSRILLPLEQEWRHGIGLVPSVRLSHLHATQGASVMHRRLCAEPTLTSLRQEAKADCDGWGSSTRSRHFPGSVGVP